MFDLIYANLIYGAPRIWRLYLTNTISILVIILLMAYMDGSRRQLNMKKTVFSGQIVVKMNEPVSDVKEILMKKIPTISYISNKLRTDVDYKLPGINSSGKAQLIGVDLEKDNNLRRYLSFNSGNSIEANNQILIPSSLLKTSDFKVGDTVRIMGKTSDKVFNTAMYRIAGVYNAAGLSLFQTPAFLISYPAMENFYFPKAQDIEYSLFFKNNIIPDNINKDIRDALQDVDRTKVDSIEAKRVRARDVLDISVQFSIFLYVMVALTILVLVTVVILVNFNIYMIIYRKRQRETGALMAFGVSPGSIILELLLESVAQIVVSLIAAVILAMLISLIAGFSLATGFLEVLFVLLSGTNRIDFYIQFYQIFYAFIITAGSVLVAQIPLLIRVYTGNPIDLLQSNH